MKLHHFPALAGLVLLTLTQVNSQAQITIADSFADLNPWSFNGGIEIDGNSSSPVNVGSSMTVLADTNDQLWASLPERYELAEVGDFLSMSFDLSINSLPASVSADFNIRFYDSVNDYFYETRIRPNDDIGGGIMSETDDSNLLGGRFNTFIWPTGSETISLSFTLTRVTPDLPDNSGFELNATGSNTANASTFDATRSSDVDPLGTTAFDQIVFRFSSNSWASSNDIQLNFSNLNVTTNVPEPASGALLVSAGLLLALRRKRRH